MSASTLRQMGLILAVAICLGLAYNATSPLAVHSNAGITGDPSPRDESLGEIQPLPAGTPDPALHNETVTATLTAQQGGTAELPKKLPSILAWPEVKSLLSQGRIVLVDARDKNAFDAGHIPGAVSLPLAELNQKIGDFMAKYAKTTALVVYCSNINCHMSHSLAATLTQQHGYADVREMPGGYAEWMVAESNAGKTAGVR
jgi:rhodanese-related sulfurtransferase